MKRSSPYLLGLIALAATGLLFQTVFSQNFAARPRVVGGTSAASSPVVVNASSLSRAVFKLVNEKRVAAGEKALVWSDDLARVAFTHSQNMAEYKFFSHRGLDNKMVSDRADDAHIGHWRAIGENIAYERGFGDPVEKAVQLWLDSPSHRDNMMDAYWHESAIGVAITSDGSYYFTQVFLRK